MNPFNNVDYIRSQVQDHYGGRRRRQWDDNDRYYCPVQPQVHLVVGFIPNQVVVYPAFGQPVFRFNR